MQATPRISDPLRIASALSPALFALGDPDRFVELLNSNPAGIVLVDAGPELTVVYCNDAFQRWAPLGRRPLIGRSLPELFAWSDRAAIRSSYREAVRSGRPVHWRSAPYHERPGGGSDGRLAYWNVSHYPLCGPAGRVTHVLTFTVDVTDQASVRARMREAQQRVLAGVGGMARHLSGQGGVAAFFDDLTDALTDLVPAARAAFWLYDADTETISPQAGAAGFTDEQLDRLRGVSCSPDGEGLAERIVFHDLVLRDQVDGVLAEATAYRSALQAVGVADTISMAWRSGGHRLGALGVYDSTRPSGFSEEDVWVLQAAVTAAALVWEHRQADAALAELREREAASLRQQIEQSMELEQLKTDFLKLASHELRGPLGVVRGYISMMEDGTLEPVEENIAPVLPLLRAKLDEMNRLINEMLETARLDDSALQLQLARLDLRDVVHEAVRSLEPLAGERHRLVTDMPGAPVEVMGDRSRLSMVVTNLVHNALKYSPNGGEVRVTCGATADGRAEVSVTDQGVGIAAEDQARRFTRFGRIVTPETAGIAGTGLGLYLARDLARRHGVEAPVASERGRGSTFTLSVPLAPAPGR
jgi:PAS domain S-box-containing protein